MTKPNIIKMSLVFVALIAVVGVLVWGPFSSTPDPGPGVNLPSMENVPPSGTHLKIEIDPSSAPPPERAPSSP